MQYRPTEANIAFIKINAMDRGVGLHLSTSSLHKRYSKTRKTQGVGENNGDRNIFIANDGSVNDNDLFDFNSVYKRG